MSNLIDGHVLRGFSREIIRDAFPILDRESRQSRCYLEETAINATVMCDPKKEEGLVSVLYRIKWKTLHYVITVR